MSLTTSLFSMSSFVTLVLVCIPLPWHLEAWNTGTCLYIFWAALGLLSFFVNSVVWADNAIDFAPVWCDISSRIVIAISVGIPCASLCINRRLYIIASLKTITTTNKEKRQAIIADLSIGLALPLLSLALQYVVQGHRYDIFEEIGCYPYTYNTPPAYFLVWSLPLVVGITSAVYSVLSIREFRQRHAEFREILSGHSNLSPNRLVRLIALSSVEVACCIPLSVVTIVLNATRAPVSPWISWKETHYGFSRVDQIPAAQWRNNPTANIGLEMTRWLVVICGLTFFAFFGFAEEAQKHYRLAFDSVASYIGCVTQRGIGVKYRVASSTAGSTTMSSKFKAISLVDLSYETGVEIPSSVPQSIITIERRGPVLSSVYT